MQTNMTVGLPGEMAEQLSALAKKQGVSRNSLLREGVKLVLEKYQE